MSKVGKAILACLLVVPFSANASLIIGQCDDTFNLRVTCDTATGFEWLDLSESMGYSIHDVLGGAGSFARDGWTVAQGSQVDDLFLNAGLSARGLGAFMGSAEPSDVAAVYLLLATLGPTSYDSRGLPIGIGTAISGTDLSIPGSVSAPFFYDFIGYAVETSGSAYRGTNYELTGDYRASGWGVYLVRTAVPEPRTISLLAVGLLAMLAMRKRPKLSRKSNTPPAR
jgi:hypothetical protein